MNRQHKFALFFLALATQLQAMDQGDHKPGVAIICGNVKDIGAQRIVISQDDVRRYEFASVVIDTADVSDEGDYCFHIKIDSPDVFQIKYEGIPMRYPVLVKSGDSLYIRAYLEEKRREYIISGNCAKINTYRQEHERRFPTNGPEYDRNKWDPESFGQFRAYIDDRKDKQIEFFEDYFRDMTLPKIFENEMRSLILYEWARERVDFLLSRYYYPEEPHYEYDSTFFSFEKSISLCDSSALNTRIYHNFIERYTELLTWKWNREEEKKIGLLQKILVGGIEADVFYKKMFEIAKTRYSGVFRDIAVAAAIRETLNPEIPVLFALASDFLKEFRTFATDTGYVEATEQRLFRKACLKTGSPAPALQAADAEGKMISLSDFKGKVVYLDFWATWCSPCVDEIPHFNKLVKKYANDGIVFMSVALEMKDEKAWRKMLQQKKIQGIALCLTGEEKERAMREWCLSTLPRAVLIDKEGRIAQSTAKNPSRKELAEDIDKLLRR